MKKDQQPITGLGAGDIGPVVFLCGDPARVDKIASNWEDLRVVCDVREYRVATGTRDGITLTAASTGIGGPSTAVIVEELAKLGAKILIRIGNSGAIADDVKLGDYVISTGAIRDDGTSKSYVRPDYPAVADYRVVSALVAAAEKHDTDHHTGITWSVDAFYARNKALGGNGGLASMSFAGYEQAGMNEQLTDAKRAGVKNIEMESSTIFTLASLFGLQAGCICTVSDRAPWPGPGQDMIELGRNIDGAIAVAVDAGLALTKKETKELSGTSKGSAKGGTLSTASTASTAKNAVLGGVASAGSTVGAAGAATIGTVGAVVGAGIGAASGATVGAKDADGATIDIETPSVDIKTPTVDIKTPTVDIESPTVDSKTPSVDIETASGASAKSDVAAPYMPATVPNPLPPREPVPNAPSIIKEAAPIADAKTSKIPSIFGSDAAPTASVPEVSRPEPIDTKPIVIPKPITIDPIEPPKPIEPSVSAASDSGSGLGGALAAAGAAGAAGAAAIGIGITGAKNAIGDATDSAASAIGSFGQALTDGTVKTANALSWDPVVALYQGRVVVDFYTPTCGPCRQMAPLFEEMALDNKDIKFAKIDASENYDLAAKFGIQSVPTFIVFEKGHKIAQTTGANADKAAFMRWVRS